ncbi:MAG: ABC transporter ATP-binding protein [Solirubrobacteraceae bacterium]|nr:ABC transporter ATP-binding protein [Solirubrobacteraceae bacterium]
MVAANSQALDAVAVNDLAKCFTVPRERSHTLKERALHPFGRRHADRFDALSGVSFNVPVGEFCGIVGRNGSGKSTLLKCLGGIYRADRGTIHVRGRMSTFIELGVGFNPDLAARDNIIANGILLGLSAAEARRRVAAVIEFAELEEFADLKLKNYSSGMHVRLAFSVMIQVEADILLIDEVLAVGDASFQQKCFDVFNDLRDRGKTILLVTHDMGSVERFCHRAILLERGELVAAGDPHEIATSYLDINFQREQASGPEPQLRGGSGEARAQELWLEDGFGERKTALAQGEPCVVRVRVQVDRPLEDPSFAIAFVNDQHQNHFVAATALERERTGRFAAGEELIFSVTFDNRLGPGRYRLSFQMAHRGGGEDVIDRWERVTSVVVVASRSAGGLVDLPCDMTIERVAGDRPRVAETLS